MTLDEFESKQRYNDFLREVEQERLYQQAKAGQAEENIIFTQKLNKWVKLLILLVITVLSGYVGIEVMAQGDDHPAIEIEVSKDSSQVNIGAND